MLKNLLEAIPLIIYFALFVAMIVATIIIVVVRFYKGLLVKKGILCINITAQAWQADYCQGNCGSHSGYRRKYRCSIIGVYHNRHK